jgi:membrane protein
MDDPKAQGGTQTDENGSRPARGWLRTPGRILRQVRHDRVPLVAAGTTFYLLLALFPALTAFVSLYGLVADPALIAGHLAALGTLVPPGGLNLAQERLESLARQDRDALSFSFVIAAAIAFWSANNGVKALFEAMNVAFGEEEQRSFVRLTLLSFGFTLGAMLVAAALMGAVAVLPLVLHLMRLDEQTRMLFAVLRWPVLLGLIALGVSLLYRYGPSREPSRWRWVSAGGVFTTVAWLAASVGFSFYLSHFANYEATYGSLGTVIAFMVWIWISIITLIVGAEIDAAIERGTPDVARATERAGNQGPG